MRGGEGGGGEERRRGRMEREIMWGQNGREERMKEGRNESEGKKERISEDGEEG